MTINMINDFLIVHFVEPLDKLSNFQNIIQGIGLALLTILIPLAIAILTDVYQKRREVDMEFAYLDLHIILDRVFKINILILGVFLIFLPMFFWDILTGLDKLIGIILIFIGVLLVVRIIINVYSWVRGDVFKLRLSYLKQIKNYYNILEINWCSVWRTKNINTENEIKYFEIFSSKIDQLLGLLTNNFTIISKLLEDFYNFINRRSASLFYISGDAFPKILEWHFKLWQKAYIGMSEKVKLYEWTHYADTLILLNSILENIEERFLKELGITNFIYDFKRHVEHYKDEFVEDDKKYYYINSLADSFYQVFFENISDSPEKLKAWKTFPEELKISKINLLDKENSFFIILSLRYFIEWVEYRISQTKEEKDFVLGEVSSNLFPEVEPNLWAKLLVFTFSGSKDRVKLAIEKPWNFGSISRVKLYPIEENEEINHKMSGDMKREEQKTYELACLLFKEKFSKEILKQYIKETNDLKYPEGSNEENEKIEWLKIFKGMLKCLNG